MSDVEKCPACEGKRLDSEGFWCSMCEGEGQVPVRETEEAGVECSYHYALGKALYQLWSEEIDLTEIETTCFLLGDEMVIQDCVDLVQLGHWMSEAFSTVVSKYHEEDQ